MSIDAPFSLIATASGNDIIAEWINGDTYNTTLLQYHTGGAWVDVGLGGHRTSYRLSSVTTNTLYTFRVQGAIAAPSAETSDWSGEATATYHSDTLTEIVTFTDSLDELLSGDVFQETVNFSDILSEVGTYVDTFTETVTFSDYLLDSQTIRTDFAYYLIDASGNVYEHGDSYLGDAGVAISSAFATKNTDFADQDMAVKDEFKELFGARLHYKDLSSSTVVSISYSTDGGTTWYPETQALGTGDETTKSAEFFFRATAHSFKFKVEHASTDKDFQWSGLEIFYLPAGEYFQI